jgi:hypothetical protein
METVTGKPVETVETGVKPVTHAYFPTGKPETPVGNR